LRAWNGTPSWRRRASASARSRSAALPEAVVLYPVLHEQAAEIMPRRAAAATDESTLPTCPP
jgi:hypothetical protein